MTKISLVLRKAGVLPFRFKNGKLEVLLVTAREGRRWTLPKGNIELGEIASAAALREAFEEAGIEGTLEADTPFGVYKYVKGPKTGDGKPATVEVFLMRVSRQCASWPEKSYRKTAWFSVEKATKSVDTIGIVQLLGRLSELRAEMAEYSGQAHRASN